MGVNLKKGWRWMKTMFGGIGSEFLPEVDHIALDPLDTS